MERASGINVSIHVTSCPSWAAEPTFFGFPIKGGLLVRAGLGVGVVHGVGRVLVFWDEDKWG